MTEKTFEDDAAFKLDNLWSQLEYHKAADGKLYREPEPHRTHMELRHENGRRLRLYFHQGGSDDPFALVVAGWNHNALHLCVGVPLRSGPGFDFARAIAWQWLFDEKLDTDEIVREVKGIRVLCPDTQAGPLTTGVAY